jgi:hypothetical protein
VTLDELEELHYIAPIVNAASIWQLGILSHEAAANVTHTSAAMAEVQERRAAKRIPLPDRRWGSLHSYANLYICARNPMMYTLVCHGWRNELCVVRVDKLVLKLGGVVIADRNAAASMARFEPAPDGLRLIDKDRVFATYWTHSDPIEQWEHKQEKCAEVLVPDRVDSQYIIGAYVACAESAERSASELRSVALQTDIRVYPQLFFA